MITWRAVDAATRPKPSGVLSYSPICCPSSSSSGTSTVTCPVLRLSSTRAPRTAPSVFSYAVSRASSMAFTSTSNGTSFSRSISRSTEMSMSIYLLLPAAPFRFSSTWTSALVTSAYELPAVGPSTSSRRPHQRKRSARSRCRRRGWHGDQAAPIRAASAAAASAGGRPRGRSPPACTPRRRRRPRRPAPPTGLAGLGDVVQRGPWPSGPSPSDDHAQQPPLTGGNHLDGVQFEIGVGQDRGQNVSDLTLLHSCFLDPVGPRSCFGYTCRRR